MTDNREHRLISPEGFPGPWMDYVELLNKTTDGRDLAGWEIESRALLCGTSVVYPADGHFPPRQDPPSKEPSMALVWLAGAIAGTFALVMWAVN